MIRVLLLLCLSCLLGACGGGTPDVVGKWGQSEPYSSTQAGVETLVSEGRTEYRADGTMRGSGRITLSGGAVPDGTQSFRLDSEGRWSRDEQLLTRTIETVTVMSESGSPEGLALAAQFEADLRANPVDQFEIRLLTRKELELANMNSGIATLFLRK